nr:putative 3,4-dihydroxy-2-butanone kinase [Ipomoea batatas]
MKSDQAILDRLDAPTKDPYWPVGVDGFSISVMKSDQAILDRLDAPTKAPYWPVGVDGNHPPAKIPVHFLHHV